VKAGRRDWLVLAAAYCVCVAGDFFLARDILPDSDLVQSFNAADAIVGGRLLLQHWSLVSDNFCFTDLPFYAAGRIFSGGIGLIYLVPVLVYALLLLAALRLAGSAAAGAAVLMLIGVPFTPGLYFMLVSDDHAATIMLCLYALLAIEPVLALNKMDQWRFVPFGLLTFAAAASDPQADVYFVAPLLILPVLRAWWQPKFRTDDWILFGCALVAGLAAAIWPRFMAAVHGFETQPDFSWAFTPGPLGLAANARAYLRGLKIIFSARRAILPDGIFYWLFAKMREITAFVVFILCLRVIWRAPRILENGVAQLLVLGAVCVSVADLASQAFTDQIGAGGLYPNQAMRYMLPVPVFTGIAAAIELRDVMRQNSSGLWRRMMTATGGLFAVIYAAAAAMGVAAAAEAPAGYTQVPQFALANWLKARGLDEGVSDYAGAQLLTALGVSTGAVINKNGVIPFRWIGDMQALDAGRPPEFAVVMAGNGDGLTTNVFVKAYGTPMEVDDVGNNTVLIFSKLRHK
jgi:hypothetical protein